MTIAEFRKIQAEKLKQNKLKPHQKISNDFIDNTIKKNNLVCLKVMFYLASVLKKQDIADIDDTNLVYVILDTKEMLQYINCTVKDIRQNLTIIQETSISFIDEKEKTVEGMNLLPYFNIRYGRNQTEIKLFKRIAKMIIEVEKNYTFINTKLLMKIKSKHTIRLLPFLTHIDDYDNHALPRKTMDINQLNDFFGTNYKTIYAIECNILKPAKDELDSFSRLSFCYEVNFDTLGQAGRPKAMSVTIDLIDKEATLLNFKPYTKEKDSTKNTIDLVKKHIKNTTKKI